MKLNSATVTTPTANHTISVTVEVMPSKKSPVMSEATPTAITQSTNSAAIRRPEPTSEPGPS
ncbi:hypothetical protein ABT116_43720 [Streptomyces sp. NPDC002130]|uniref:hypothetical protein n=1 Tax=Streptomyces sp. NPDC002130 TaxID=3155568 RepID=UPI00331811BB